MILFTPFTAGRLKLKNRILMPAVHHAFTPEGFVNERLIEYYRLRARGGAAMITVGGCAIDQVGAGPMMIGLNDDKFIAGLSELAAVIKNEGAKVAAQLYQAGRYAFGILNGITSIAPSPIPSRLTRETPRAMNTEDIAQVTQSFCEAAKRAEAAGFDAVEIIASAGYLLGQFLSPLTNQRTDDYGASFENRQRFGLEVTSAVKKSLKPETTLIIRLSGHDFMPGSSQTEEIAAFAYNLEAAGVDLFNITGGWHESRVPQITGEVPRGAFAYLAYSIKKAVKKPVIASNRLGDPLVAEKVLQLGLANLINMGRPLIADPALPVKAKEGRFKEIRRCIACNQGCLDSIFTLNPVHCTINARAGRELETELQPAAVAKKVLVVGGGPAGLEAARVAALRGHQVSLWEKEAALGGLLNYAALPPGKAEFATLLDYYKNELLRLGVQVLLNREAKAEEIVSEQSEAVILATGTRAAQIPFAIEAEEKIAGGLDILSGRVVPGKNTVVVGGGSAGCEIALFVAEMGTLPAETLKFLSEHEAESPARLNELLNQGAIRVTIVETEKGLGRDMGISTRWIALKNLKRLGVKVEEEASVVKIGSDGVHIKKGENQKVIPADTVIITTGVCADNALQPELAGKIPQLFLVGDAKEPRKLTEAIKEGFAAGQAL